MAYDPTLECTVANRLTTMLTISPALLGSVLVGPCLWTRILRKSAARSQHASVAGGSGDKRQLDSHDSSLAFLTGCYKEQFRLWEVCRLSKSMLLASISTMSPATYCPGQRLALALVVVGSFLLAHCVCAPYSVDVVNRLEMMALAVLALAMVAAVFLTGESWSKTEEMEAVVLFGTAGMLFVALGVLVGFFLYAKFFRAEEVMAGFEHRTQPRGISEAAAGSGDQLQHASHDGTPRDPCPNPQPPALHLAPPAQHLAAAQQTTAGPAPPAPQAAG